MPRSFRADITALNHIAAVLIDARRLYARAASLANMDQDLVGMLERTLGERAMLLSDVQERVRMLSGTPQTTGSLLVFFDVRAIIGRDLDTAMAEIERGEAYLRDEIRKCMRRDDISADTRAFFGLALDRVVSGEMRVDGAREQVEHYTQH